LFFDFVCLNATPWHTTEFCVSKSMLYTGLLSLRTQLYFKCSNTAQKMFVKKRSTGHLSVRLAYLQFVMHYCITVPSNLIPIAAVTQSIEKELARWRIEPKNSAALRCFVAFKHRIRSICLYRHCNALHFGNKRPVDRQAI